MSQTKITCPNCNTQFEPNDALRDEMRRQMQEWKVKQQREFEQKEQEFRTSQEQREQELKREFEKQRTVIAQEAAKEQEARIVQQYEHQIRHLNEANLQNEERLKAAREKELEFLRKMSELQHKEQEMNIRMQEQLLQARSELSQQVRKEEEERSRIKEQEYQFKLKEIEQQLEQQRKLAEEMKRKAEQGSMQLQGEVQEIMLEALLRQRFPMDQIEEVGKGQRGSDCIQLVRNQFGQPCGKIVYESKRTAAFSNDWIDKVKADMRSQGGDIAVIVTQVLPKEIESFGMKDGVWICSFREVAALALLLREQILKVYQVIQSRENKSDKMSLLYEYLTGNEFSEQWKAIREGFQSMKMSIQKERDAMERLWKAREKQLEKILLNAAHIRGSVDGIAGLQQINLDLNADDDELLLLE
ncbi:DUF2130 domain-containing protein [Rurimicrobium arvi]|uniref:DUF2130 domain-containing protein n=1 Tax=Rurimicrobium arvi TaxID=2049916 RepID=A0ABP8MXX1_9BACT